jgi:hypothetical protein
MKCNWCPNEISSNYEWNGNSKFCSKKCLNEFYAAYPNQKSKDDKDQKSSTSWSNFLFVVIILVFIVGFCVNDHQNTTGEQVSETDVVQVYETDTEQDYEPAPEENYEPAPEENYEPIPETKYIIKRHAAGWFQCDVNYTSSWTLNFNDGRSYKYLLETEDDNFYNLRSLDDSFLYAIPKDFGMSYIWNEQSQTFDEMWYIKDDSY